MPKIISAAIPNWNHFKDQEEPRRLTHILHPASNIIYITFAAILCGLRGWEDIANFGEERREFFEKRLDLSNGIPSHDTIDRFFQLVDKDSFNRCFMSWVSSVACEVEVKRKPIVFGIPPTMLWRKR